MVSVIPLLRRRFVLRLRPSIICDHSVIIIMLALLDLFMHSELNILFGKNLSVFFNVVDDVLILHFLDELFVILL